MAQALWSGRLRESAKLGIRRVAHRANLSIARDPFSARLVRTLTHAGIDTVVDVGANVGQYGSQLRTAGFAGRIVSLEPMSEAFATLSARSAKDPAWEVEQLAAGAEPGTATINISQNSYSSSIREMTDHHLRAAPESVVVGTEEVTVDTVAAVLARRGIDPARTLLKIDTQGFEEAVLDGAGAVLESIAAVQLELSFVELYRGQALYDDLVARMRDLGLTLWSLETGISGPDGRLLQVDGLFVRV